MAEGNGERSTDGADESPIEVPYQQLSARTLERVIDDFILREGTDYGETECPLEEKRAQVLRQLERRKAKILFDEKSETCTIVLCER